MENTGKVGTYIRPSTGQQDDQHQRNSITRYIDEHGLPQDRVEQYVDIESGSNDEREQFNALLDAIRNDEFGSAGGDGTAGEDGTAGGDGTASAATGSFRRGVLVNALNPKVALFFLAFLPGFAGSGPDVAPRMLLLGATYAALTAAYLAAVAIASGRVGDALASATTTSRLSWLGGGVMIVLGAALAIE